MSEPAPRRRALKLAFLAVYAVLLAASTLVRLGQEQPPLPAGLRATTLPAFEGASPTAGQVRFAWREWPAAAPDAPVLLLIHGSPGESEAMEPLARALGQDYRRISVDLPGFGGSTRDVPDYSVLAHAAYVRAFLDDQHLDRVHVIVHSMGGGVVAELSRLAPERVASMTLIAALGTVEYELLGSQAANHAVHAAQLAGIWGLTWLTPHFGRLDGAGLDLPYARNFYDTDQERLRGAFEAWGGPTLVLHGERDFLVPVGAARETARIVPQARLLVTGGTHFDIFEPPDDMLSALRGFIAEVEAGAAPTRATADPARIAAAAAPFDPHTTPPAMGPTLLVLAGLLGLATLVSEDLACITAGLLVAQGRMGFFAATLGCFLGIFLGDLGLLALGRWVGRPLLRAPPLRWWVSEAAVDRASAWYVRNGASVIFTSRFMPGARLPLYLAAGLLKTPAWRFAGLFAVAAGVWTPLLVGGSALVGERVKASLDEARLGLGVGLALAVALVLVMRTVVPLATWRGRRLALSWWRRQTRWEFWPMWRVYPPVILHIIRLMSQYRSLTLFTACNPGMPHGGVIGESKRDIYARLGGDQNPAIPATLSLPVSEPLSQRLARAQAFIAARGLGWPVVLKPDTGQRGAGVAIVRSEAEIERYRAATPQDTLLQEHLGGVEYGLFYVRRPSEPSGRLFSVTEKRPLDVVGDGVSTLEHLILADDRAVCMAAVHLKKHADRLEQVPARGEVVRLVEIGTHSRGSVFLDGSEVVTPALTEAVDRLCKGFEGGFYFGRFDVRAESVHALREGRFRIIELNGATSEAVHIYDPKNPITTAWRVLCEQWTLCFEIAAEAAARGAPVSTPRALLKTWWEARQLQRRQPT